MDQKRDGEMPGSYWNPVEYLKFSDHRLRPAIELLRRIPLDSPQVIYDLGCGTGNVTRLLAEHWNDATVYGLDNSKDMLQRAQAERGRISWQKANIGDWTPQEAPDLIYSNATLHWVPGHDELFPRLAGFLRVGGCLAVQMPLSFAAASHRLMRATLAGGGPGGCSLGTRALRDAVAQSWVEDPRVYYDLLTDQSQNLDIWETEYLQILEGKDPVLEWMRGAGLRPIVNGLDDDEREIFLTEYRRRLRKAYPLRPDGRTLYPFRRLFIVAIV